MAAASHTATSSGFGPLAKRWSSTNVVFQRFKVLQLVPVIIAVASLAVSFEVVMLPPLAAESRLLVRIHATIARSVDIGIISGFDAISLPIIAKGQIVVNLTRPDLSDLPPVVEPLSGMSQVSLVVLARSEVLLEHGVLLLVDLVTLVLHPLLHDLLRLLLLVV